MRLLNTEGQILIVGALTRIWAVMVASIWRGTKARAGAKRAGQEIVRKISFVPLETFSLYATREVTINL